MCLWTFEFVFEWMGQTENKYGTVQELRSTFSHTKSNSSDFSLVFGKAGGLVRFSLFDFSLV